MKQILTMSFLLSVYVSFSQSAFNSCLTYSIGFHANGKMKWEQYLYENDTEGCNPDTLYFTQIMWHKNGLVLMSIDFNNTWYETGQPHCVLVKLENRTWAYRHYNQEGKLIGEEFFHHDFENLKFYEYTDVWWREINGVRTAQSYPPYYTDDYFRY